MLATTQVEQLEVTQRVVLEVEMLGIDASHGEQDYSNQAEEVMFWGVGRRHWAYDVFF